MKLVNSFLTLSLLLCSIFFLIGCTDEFENIDSSSVNVRSIVTERGGNVSSKIALLHMNPVLGDKNANIGKLESLVAKAFINGANIVVTPELSTSGYCITKEQVFDGLGLVEPFDELVKIKEMAIRNNGYVFVGLPEIADNVAYNTVAVFGPRGYIGKQRKRAKSEWHEVGNLPYDVIKTPYGDIGFLICSDAYLPDITRILSLKGADILVSSANWWGEGISATQLDVWKTNAHDNSVWNFVANRWGTETDNRNGYSYVYDMSTAPSAIINPFGDVVFSYMASEDNLSKDTIFFGTATVPVERIGSTYTNAFSINNRKTSAYQAIGNDYYNPDNGNLGVPGLPNAGLLSCASLSYVPSANLKGNMEILRDIFRQKDIKTDVVVAPALGLGRQIIDIKKEDWYKEIAELQSLVDENKISLFATTVQLSTDVNTIGLLVVQEGREAQIIPQIHDRFTWLGIGKTPYYLDLPNARIGIVTGTDFNFPETTTSLAKSGVDIILISSDLGKTNEDNSDNYYWNVEQLKSLILTRSNHCVHLLLADHLGVAMGLRSEWGTVAELKMTESNKDIVTMELNAVDTRTKYLNRYQPFDLVTLIGH